MNVRVLMEEMKVEMADAKGQTFIEFLFSKLFLKVDKDEWKRQIVRIFGYGFASNAYSYSSSERKNGKVYKKKYPFLRSIYDIEDMTKVSDLDPGEDFHKESFKQSRKNMRKLSKDYDYDLASKDSKGRKKNSRNSKNYDNYDHDNDYDSPDEILSKMAVEDRQALSQPGRLRIKVDQKPTGDKDIEVFLENSVVNLILPVIMGIKDITQMTTEMQMNYEIRPCKYKLIYNF